MDDPAIERVLQVLANPNRLSLLKALQSPRAISEVTLSPTRDDRWGGGDRAITRQAVARHVQELMDIGVVVELSPADASAGARYVIDHARLYAVVEQLRQIAIVKPNVDVAAATLKLHAGAGGATIEGPHLALARGVREGALFPLREGAEWVIGRAKTAAVSLDYDPYVSTEHARVFAKDGRFFLADSLSNKNGTILNWAPMTRGGIAPLEPGDIIGVGMSLLVFRM